MSSQNIENTTPAANQNGDSIWRVQSKELRSAVKMARDAHDTIVPPEEESLSLQQCQFCDRSFKADRLVVHNRSCTAFSCARRINESVRPAERHTSPTKHSSPSKRKLPTAYHLNFSSYNLDLEQYPHALEKLDPQSLSKCNCCARTFLSDRLAVHARSCTTDHPCRSVGDCNIGDPYADRIALIKFGTGADIATSASTNWRAASTAFREAVRQAKQKEADAAPTVLECPHCLKKYREKAAARHVLVCDRKEGVHRASPSKWRGQSLHFRMQLREAKDNHLASAVINHWQEAMVLEG